MNIRQQSRFIYIIKGQRVDVRDLTDRGPIDLLTALFLYFCANNTQLTENQINRKILFWAQKHQKLLWRFQWHCKIRKKVTDFPADLKIEIP